MSLLYQRNGVSFCIVASIVMGGRPPVPQARRVAPVHEVGAGPAFSTSLVNEFLKATNRGSLFSAGDVENGQPDVPADRSEAKSQGDRDPGERSNISVKAELLCGKVGEDAAESCNRIQRLRTAED